MSEIDGDAGLGLKSSRGRLVLAAAVLGSGMAQLDATVVNVALPRIGKDLHAGLTSLQWTLNAYTLTLSGLLLLGGALGDRVGRRRVFVIGVVWFAAASVLCAVAPSVDVLVAARGLKGVGAALLTPGSLAILQAVFRRQDKAAAVGAWSGLGGVATAIGPVVGGILVAATPWGWRLAFLLNLPLALVVVLLARFIPESRDERSTGRLDYPGALYAAAGLAALIYALTEGPATDWSPSALVSLGVGIVLLAGFFVHERRAANPMVPLAMFGSRQFAAANAVTLVVYAALAGALFLLPLQLQLVAGFSPVAAGSATLPVTVVMLVLSARMGRVAQRIGPRLPMTVGPIVAGVGLALLVRVDASSGYVSAVLPAVLIFALGLSMTVAPLTATALAAAEPARVGVASAINNDIARVAGLLAVAVLPAVAGISASAYGNADQLSNGFHHAVLIAGALLVGGGLLAAATIRNDVRTASPADAAAVETHTHTVVPVPHLARDAAARS